MKKLFIFIFVLILCMLLGIVFMKKDSVVPYRKIKKEKVNDSFDIKFLKEVNSLYDENYLISPYSIKVALSMLREGADGNTFDEINNLLGDDEISNISSDNIGVANILFIKNRYKDYIEESFQNILLEKYSSEVLFDEFSAPDVINHWVDEKTNNMIPKILDSMSPDFVLGLANALAIDVKWETSFDCVNTTSEVFKSNSKVINAEMMHAEYEDSRYKYFVNDNSKGIILPYKSDGNANLEFVGILPNGDIDSYISDMSMEKIDTNVTKASDKFHINLSLPRFSYAFDLDDFKLILYKLGMKDAFDENSADFTKIMIKDNMHKNGFNHLYVSEAIHKTKIELNENGTRAAVVTYFGLFKDTAIPDKPKVVSIKFDRPFIYLIRDKKSHQVLFVGAVYEPNVWNGSTCSETEE